MRGCMLVRNTIACNDDLPRFPGEWENRLVTPGHENGSGLAVPLPKLKGGIPPMASGLPFTSYLSVSCGAFLCLADFMYCPMK